MPKEPKKFINPLLRPSYITEPKPVTVSEPEPQKSIASEEPSSKQMEAPQEKEATPVKNNEPENDFYEGVQISTVATPQKKSDFPKFLKPAPVEFSATEEALPEHHSQIEEPVLDVVTERIPPMPTYLSPSEIDIPASVTNNALQKPEQQLEEAKQANEVINPLPLETQEPVTNNIERVITRRKRGAVAFEEANERLTIWIDKQLKQSFEDLAYKRCVSKTTLLNEAVADLLQKYEKR